MVLIKLINFLNLHELGIISGLEYKRERKNSVYKELKI